MGMLIVAKYLYEGETKMKKILALTLALLFVVVALAACSGGASNNNDGIDAVEKNERAYSVKNGDYTDVFYYDVVNGDEIVITGFASSHEPHAIVVPTGPEIISASQKEGEEIVVDKYKLTAINDGAFKNKTNITAVTLPDTVTKIGALAFAECSSLASINIPNGVTLIGEAAFTNTALTSITLPDSVLASGLGKMAFYGCRQLTTVTLPAGLETIKEQTFMNCVALTTVNAGDALKTIEAHAFGGCTVLNSFVIPASITTIGDYAFAECAAFTKPTLAEGVTVGTNAFYGTIGA